MFCFFRSCVEEERRKASHDRNVRFNEEVVILNVERTPEFIKTPNHSAIPHEKSNNIEKEEPIFTLS
jgi:hypothetical protein